MESLNSNSISIDRPRCPYCHDDIRPEDEKRGCAQCMTWFHEECLQELGRCTNCGDQFKKTKPAPKVKSNPIREAELVPIERVKKKISVYSDLANALITDEQRRAIDVAGFKAGLASVLIATIPITPVAILCKMTLKPEEYLGTLVGFGVTFLISVFVVMYSLTKKNKWREILKDVDIPPGYDEYGRKKPSHATDLDDPMARARKNQRNQKRRQRKKRRG